jgi:hypothetical protein
MHRYVAACTSTAANTNRNTRTNPRTAAIDVNAPAGSNNFVRFIMFDAPLLSARQIKTAWDYWRLEFKNNLHKIARFIRYIRRTPTFVGVFSSFSDVCKRGSYAPNPNPFGLGCILPPAAGAMQGKSSQSGFVGC